MLKHGCSLGAAMMLGTLASAAPAAAETEVMFCNKTGSKVYIAIAYYQEASRQWKLSAWFNAGAGSCKSIGKLRSGLFYYFAEKEGRKFHWPAASYVDKTFCVPTTKVLRTLNGGSCGSGERNLGFRGTTAEGPRYTVNLQ